MRKFIHVFNEINLVRLTNRIDFTIVLYLFQLRNLTAANGTRGLTIALVQGKPHFGDRPGLHEANGS